jgi:hypothetical protein
MNESLAPQDLISRALADAGAQWSLGTFGAIAEFSREPDEPGRLGAAGIVTDKGGIRLACPGETRAVAYETINKHPDQWAHAVAFCLPEASCAMNGRAVLTELGPDAEALRAEDRDAVLFDMGLDTLQVDVCIRTSDPELLAALRANAGRAVFEHGNPVMMAILRAGPHRVFVTKLGRAEVYQPIPAPDGRSPDGPHTHVLPKLLRSRRTHAATAPIPRGLVPCAHLYPQHPCKDALGRAKPFDAAQHESVQALLDRFGDPGLVSLKREVSRRLAEGSDPDSFLAPEGRYAHAALRVALRQAKAAGLDAPMLSRWRQVYDASAVDEPEDEQQQHGA